MNQHSDLGKVFSIFERMQPGFKEEHPPCIDDRGASFQNVWSVFHNDLS